MILSVIYWFFAVSLAALAVGGSLVVYHQYEHLDNRPFFCALGMTAFAAAVAFFLPLDVFPFRILIWLLCAWLGMIGLAATLWRLPRLGARGGLDRGGTQAVPLLSR